MPDLVEEIPCVPGVRRGGAVDQHRNLGRLDPAHVNPPSPAPSSTSPVSVATDRQAVITGNATDHLVQRIGVFGGPKSNVPLANLSPPSVVGWSKTCTRNH